MCRQFPSEDKSDIHFQTDGEIAEMIAEFEACRWPFARWSHRCHLAAGAWYLRRLAFEEALIRVRTAIQRYNRACGSGSGYHETITRFFLLGIRDRLEEMDQSMPLVIIVEDLARTRTMAWVREHYSRQTLESPAAIDGWVEPDQKPFPVRPAASGSSG